MEIEPRAPLKRIVFSGQIPHKAKVMKTSLIEMLELPNLGRMTPSTIEFQSHEKILLITSWTVMMMS